MKALFIDAWRVLQIRWYSWALDSIDPHHEELPYIVCKLNWLIRQRNSA